MEPTIASSANGFIAALNALDGGAVLNGLCAAEILFQSAERHENAVVQAKAEAARIAADASLSATGKSGKLRELYARALPGREKIAVCADMLAALREERAAALRRVQSARVLPCEGDPLLVELRAQEVRAMARELPEAQRVALHADSGPEVQRALEGGPLPLLPSEYVQRVQDERARGVVPDAVEALARLDALLSGLAEHEARFPAALATACGLPLSYPDEYRRAQEAAARRREVA